MRAVLLMARELHLGGSERQMAEVARALDRTRFEAHVGTFRPNGLRGDELRRAGVPVVHFPVYSFRSWGAIAGAWRMAAYIRRHRIELVHAFDAPMAVYATPVVRYFTRALMLSSQRGHRDLTPEYRKLLRWTDRRVDAIVVNCEYLKRHVIEEEGAPERLLRLCYNGIDLEQFQRSTLPRPAALPKDAMVIGVVCALRPEKDVATLIRAFSRVRSPGRMKLAVVGSGPALESLQAVARETNCMEDCVWEPATSEVARWLTQMDIFVLPSRSEAFSNALMEAMACGCAVIASNVGGNPELVEHGERGLLFEAGNEVSLAEQLRLLMEDSELRRRLAGAGERFIRDGFSIAASAARMGGIYESLLESRRR